MPKKSTPQRTRVTPQRSQLAPQRTHSTPQRSHWTPQRTRVRKTPIYAVDFGTGIAMQIWGPDGSMPKSVLSLPRVPGGKTPRDEFNLLLTALLRLGDVVVESPTIGASGAEVGDVLEIVGQSKNTLWTVSARAVKNYRRDNNLPWHKGARYAKDGTTPPPAVMLLHEKPVVHVEDAEIIYKLATKTPWRLRKWHIAEPCPRLFTSVRPSDKRGYRDERSEAFMAIMPPFETLPDDIAESVGVAGDYSRSLIMPFAMALHEPWLGNGGPPEERRKRFIKILGAYDAGYPSFYRRMTVTWMHGNAKALAGVTRMEDVPHRIRKQALRMTQKQIRHLFHLSSH